jgi:hypothetical protein
VLAFGNGALGVRGSCDADSHDQPSGEEAFCLMPPGGQWSEMRFRGDDASLARVVVLADGRVVLVRPPRAEDLSTASLTITDGLHTTARALRMPVIGLDTARALRLGVWMDGFEERRPGVLGGWVEAAGALVGLEIALDGDVRVGEYIRDEGAPVASGRWALGWTASRRGFETTDGGMTWSKGMDLPEPVGSSAPPRDRACGPIGCIAAGWLRIGWGPSLEPSQPAFPSPHPLRAERTSPPLRLDCEPVAARPVEKPASSPPAAPRTAAAPPMFVLSLGGATLYGAGSTSGTVSEFPSFCGRTAPRLRADERGFTVEVSDVDRSRRAGGQGVVYAWGPATGDWDRLGKWEVRWQWPWGGCSSASGPAPWTTLDGARRALGKGIGPPTWWVVAQGDDADHALFIARHTLGVPTADVVEIESGRPPADVRGPGGDPFPDIEGALRVGGRWYLATAQPPSELAATVVWVLEGGAAHEVARVPRAGVDFRAPIHLARRADGRSLGLAVEGQPRADGPAFLWITSVDLETGSVGDPEPLAAADLSDTRVNLCTGDDAGWRLVMPYPGFVEMDVGANSSSLKSPLARLRVSRDGACLESIFGPWDDYATTEAKKRAPRGRVSGGGGVRTIDVGVLSSGRRFPLLCARP